MPPTETLAPDAIVSSTNLSGAVTDIDEPIVPITANLEALFLSNGTGTLRGSPSNTEQSGNLETVRAALIAGGDTTVYMKQWDDASGNAAHAAQATAGNQPKFIANAIGSNVGFFEDTGTDDISLTASLNPLPPSTAYLVCQPSVVAFGTPCGNGQDSAGIQFLVRDTGAIWFRVVEDDLSSSWIFYTTTTYSANQALVLCMAYDSSNLVGSVNGAEEAGTPAITLVTGSGTFSIGRGSAGYDGFDGAITAIAVYSAMHDAGQRATMVAWLTANYT